ncbi:glycosyltransferase family 2 protein [Geodermatophilus sp. URMC 62]|uniref:glycosyltransferase family 2 protein n=1 Tax=Geodermatophilus sp. URMC 62 TaxID=3423414 RepID=UPI00406C9136
MSAQPGPRVPRTSVIIIFFNADDFIDEAITSVMAQTVDDFELLLCDDGSEDSSTAIAVGWAARHPDKVRHLSHERHANRGMSATRNLGIRAARGEFIAFLDADDVWRPGKLAEQLAVLDAHPEVGMVCGTVRYWRSWAGGEDEVVPTGHVRGRVVRPPETSLAVYPLGEAPAPCPSDMLLRRAAVESVGGFEEHFSGVRQMYEDQGFLSKLYLRWPVYFADDVWLDYRQHSASFVATVHGQGGYDEARSYFLTWFDRYLAELPDAPPAVRRAVARALRARRRPVLDRALRLLGRVRHRTTAPG